MIEITIEKVKESIAALVDDTTSYNSLGFESLEVAINHYIEHIHKRVNDFEVLTQQMIDEQNENYSDDYLYDAKVGDLVWGDDEMWVSQATVESWSNNENQVLSQSHNDIKDIADVVENDLIIEVLSDYNSKAKA